MKFIRLAYLVLIVFLAGRDMVISQELSPSAQVSILTCGQGDQLYSIFGHSAIRVFDPQGPIDKVYNYGTFDFDAPNFALNFLRGKLTFWVTATTFERFLGEYYYTQRSVKEQVLQLSAAEKQSIYTFLENNVRPENRSYQYDFYFDNCTTRLRDILEQTIDIHYPEEGGLDKTYRDLLHENLGRHPWTQFGMDIILGTSSDEVAPLRGQMFLPQYYYDYLEESTVGSNRGSEKVVAQNHLVLDFPVVLSSSSWLPDPATFFWILLLLEAGLFILTYIGGHPIRFNIYDKVWFSVLFMAFIIFMIMWLFTDHSVCRNNWNILWTCPWMIFCLFTKTHTRISKILLVLNIVVSVLILAGWNAIPQDIHPAIVPLVLIHILKSLKGLGMIKWIDHFKKTTAVFCLFWLSLCLHSQERIAGITMVGSPHVYEADPLPPIARTNANWIALVPFGFSRVGEPEVYWGSDSQWWGESAEGVVENIRLAKSYDIKVMIKPQVWIPRGWVGEMDFANEADWQQWESSYRDYILFYTDLAIAHDVDMICIGTEYRVAVVKRASFWRKLIEEIRSRYSGLLVYSANWDSYDEVPFWDKLDYIGISSYFPLSSMDTPPQMLLNFKWRGIKRKMERFSQKWKKKIIFTEFGYLSVDGSAGKTWELEKEVRSLTVNERAQANAYASLLSSFASEKFWSGGFLWKWFPNGKGHEGYPERDYTPQGKLSEAVITAWYQKILAR